MRSPILIAMDIAGTGESQNRHGCPPDLEGHTAHIVACYSLFVNAAQTGQ